MVSQSDILLAELNESTKSHKSYLAQNLCWVVEAGEDEQRWSWFLSLQPYSPKLSSLSMSPPAPPPNSHPLSMLSQTLLCQDASSDFSNFCFALQYEANTSTFISLKTIKLEETRNNEKSSPWGVFHRERSILTVGCQSLLSPQLEGKKLTTVFPYVSKEELSVIQLNSPFFLLVLLRSVLIAKKKICGRIYVAMCLLIIFRIGITKKKQVISQQEAVETRDRQRRSPIVF